MAINEKVRFLVLLTAMAAGIAIASGQNSLAQETRVQPSVSQPAGPATPKLTPTIEDLITSLPLINKTRENGVLRMLGIDTGALQDRRDLTEGLYAYCLDHLSSSSGKKHEVAPELLPFLPPPSEETLRKVLKLRKNKQTDWFWLRELQTAALHHAAAAAYPGLAYEVTPFLTFLMQEGSAKARAYFEKNAARPVGAGFFRAIRDGWSTDDGVFTRPMQGVFSIYHIYADITSQSLAQLQAGSPYPTEALQRGLFASFPQDDALRKLIRQQIQQRSDPATTAFYNFGSQQHLSDLLALRALVRQPQPDLLPALLPMMRVAISSKVEMFPRRPMDSEGLIREILYNPGCETRVAAAQAILALGRPAAPAVLQYLQQRLVEESKKSPGGIQIVAMSDVAWPPLSDIDTAVLILGWLANPALRSAFVAALADRERHLQSVKENHTMEWVRSIHNVTRAWYDNPQEPEKWASRDRH